MYNTILNILKDEVKFNFMNHCNHTADVINILKLFSLFFFCHNWSVNGVNRILLAGKESQMRSVDNIFMQAHKYLSRKNK